MIHHSKQSLFASTPINTLFYHIQFWLYFLIYHISYLCYLSLQIKTLFYQLSSHRMHLFSYSFPFIPSFYQNTTFHLLHPYLAIPLPPTNERRQSYRFYAFIQSYKTTKKQHYHSHDLRDTF